MIFEPHEIKARREDVGWTQKKLADESGVSQSSIAKIENVTMKAPSLDLMKKLTDTLNKERVIQNKITPVSKYMTKRKDMVIAGPKEKIGKYTKIMRDRGISRRIESCL